MDVSRREIAECIASTCKGENYVPTQIAPLSFYHHREPTEMLAILYEPSLCVIVQGEKAVGTGEELFHYNPDTYLLASVHTPARVCVTHASFQNPYMGLTITFSMEQIFEVLKEIDTVGKRPLKADHRLYFGAMEEKLMNPILRLVRLLDIPEDIPVLSTLIVKEILYILMRGEGGDFIRRYIMESSSTQQVVKAISYIKANFSQTLHIPELAKSIGMSESSLYANFKKITDMSPLQFQKTLRLQEARRKLMMQEIDASQVAFEVGYESPSQFSREYARMYGLPPKADVRHLRGGCTQ